MLVPLIWQKDYVKIDRDLKTITDRLSETGSHVEEVIIHTGDLETIVVGHVLKQVKHDNADRLKVLTIDIGEDQPTRIVTAAKNTKEGDYLFVIKSGTELANGHLIEDHDFFGVISKGMLTSYSELGYPDNVIPKEFKDGVIILEGEFKPGTSASSVLFSNSPVIEYEITPNRPDCLSILGMARESAASFDTHINLPEIDYCYNAEKIEEYSNGIEIRSQNANRFIARVAKNIKVKKSPQRLQNYLMLAGMRPINNIVDITNFVMLETGQPLHAYDLDKLADQKIIVRGAYEGEKIRTLDGEERELDSDMLVIADGKEAIGIAGIMGGYDSEVTNETKNILLEAANFDADNIRQTSKKLSLRSEASTRFEKEVSNEMADFASRRVMNLIDELDIGEIIGGVFDVGDKSNPDKFVDMRISRLNLLTGVDFDMEYAKNKLELLEFEVEILDSDTLRAKVPSFRIDIDIEVDLIEEVVRLFGMGNITPKPLKSILKRGERSDRRILRDDLREKLVGQKFSEITTYSFISPKEYDRLGILEDSKLRDYIKLINPLGEDFSIMRTTQIPQMLEVISKNIKRGQKDLRLFETGKTFEKTKSKLPNENDTLTMGLYGNYTFYDLKDYFTEIMKNIGFLGLSFREETNLYAFHAGRCANIYYKENKIGVMGEISYPLREEYDIAKGCLILEVNISLIEDQRDEEKKYTPLPKYPAIMRDYSFVTDRDKKSSVIEKIFFDNGENLISKIELFDIYTGDQLAKDKKSISYKVEYRSDDKTLKEKDISDIERNILEDLRKENVILRS